MSLPPLWYQSHSVLAGDSVVVFSVFLFVSTRNFDTPLLCSLFTIVGATLVVKLIPRTEQYGPSELGERVGHERNRVD